MIVKLLTNHKQMKGLLIIDKQLASSPEPLFAIRWSQDLPRWRQVAEDGACCLHSEDKVEVGNHHGNARQKGKTKPKTADAAAKCCSNPVNESGHKINKHAGCCLIVTQKQKVKKIGLTVQRQR